MILIIVWDIIKWWLVLSYICRFYIIWLLYFFNRFIWLIIFYKILTINITKLIYIFFLLLIILFFINFFINNFIFLLRLLLIFYTILFFFFYNSIFISLIILNSIFLFFIFKCFNHIKILCLISELTIIHITIICLVLNIIFFSCFLNFLKSFFS